MRWLRVILVLGAFVHLSGGHYGVLQCIAWSKMLVEYSSSDGLIEGARKTFDGAHPCCMCKSIAAAKDAEQKNDAPLPGVEKLSLKDLRLPETVSLISPRPRDHSFSGFDPPVRVAGTLGDRPPSPPPRGV